MLNAKGRRQHAGHPTRCIHCDVAGRRCGGTGARPGGGAQCVGRAHLALAAAANGLHQQQAAPAQQQPQQQQLQQAPQQQAPQQQAPQHVPQHDSIAPGPQGLGGVPVQPPPRQPSFADSASTAPTGANTWGPPQKPAAQAAPGPNLGSSLMASLSGGGGGLPQASPPLSDPAIVSHSLGGSGSLGGLTGGPPEGPKAPVILPPSAQQVPS